MLHALRSFGCLLTVSSFAAQPSLAVDEYQYSGSLMQVERRGDPQVVKQFDLYCLGRSADAGTRLFFTVDERGGGAWAWPERFGEATLNAAGKRTGGRPPHVLHTFEGTRYPVELPSPVFEYADKLAASATWTVDGREWEVRGQKKIGDHDCWQVSAVDRFGRPQSYFVAKNSSLVVAAERRVFMGRGDEFRVRIELTSWKPLADDAGRQVADAADALLQVQSGLERPEGITRPELSEAQLAGVAEKLDGLLTVTKGTRLVPLAEAISRDVRSQQDRDGNLSRLAQRFVGQPAPTFALQTLDRKAANSDSQKGKVTILHFWEYRGEPLEEPYGQVGYLDYLANRRARFGVDVIGVAVNEEFATPATTGAALRSVRKLRDFMNLSYPIATDSGDAIRQFGDPRQFKADLPLWVVIGADGKVAHYHVGNYQIKADEGLRELDAVIVKLVREQRTTE
ncbi:redoxin domain-containing protein [bacterium]|nr:redoxin domain-containing protein [bacterium]